MSVQTSLMIDTTHAAIAAHPDIVRKQACVGGYVTGSADIRWTAEDWESVGTAVKIRILQNPGISVALSDIDEIDVEAHAYTPSQAASVVKWRVEHGIEWTGIYANRADLAETAKAIQALGHGVWNGHVGCRLADWNLDRAGATKLVGQLVEGMTCYGVQWASPSSNPITIIPGMTGLTLREANVDLSVVDLEWVERYLLSRPAAKPAPGPVTLSRIVAEYSDGSRRVLLTV